MLIRVDPVILKQNSDSISGIGSSVNSSGQSTSGIAQAAPSYDGQFGPQVQAIGHEALARSQGLLGAMNNLSSQLMSKAQAFEVADIAGVAGFANINDGTQIPATGPWWTGLPVDIINLILKLGGLLGGVAFTGLLGTVLLGNGLYSGNGQPLNGLEKPSWWPAGVPWPYGGKQPVESSKSVPSPAKMPNTIFDGTAFKVPAFDNRKLLSEWKALGKTPEQNSDSYGLYPRGDGTTASNCTWYAAAAVSQMYKIPLNSGLVGKAGKFSTSLGSGGQWAENGKAAIDPSNPLHQKYIQYQPYINSVDKIPSPGAVYSTPGTTANPEGHVMFVEQATKVEINGKLVWEVKVSEEIYGGKDAYSGATPVALPGNPDVKRWVRTITLPIDESGGTITNGSFIRFINPAN